MAPAFYPPSFTRAGNPQTTVYMNLQPPVGTARRSPVGWWSLTPPSHPYPARHSRIYRAVVLFCRHLLSPIASTFRSGAPYAARTFLPHLAMPATSRSSAFSVQRYYFFFIRPNIRERRYNLIKNMQLNRLTFLNFVYLLRIEVLIANGR